MLARDRLAKLIEIRLDQLAVFEKDAGAFDGRGVAPAGEGGMRGLDRGVDLSRAAGRALGDDVTGGRIENRRAGDFRLEPFAVDEEGAGSEIHEEKTLSSNIQAPVKLQDSSCKDGGCGWCLVVWSFIGCWSLELPRHQPDLR